MKIFLIFSLLLFFHLSGFAQSKQKSPPHQSSSLGVHEEEKEVVVKKDDCGILGCEPGDGDGRSKCRSKYDPSQRLRK